MSDINRRDAVKLMALIAAGASVNFSCGVTEDHATRHEPPPPGSTQPGPDYRHRFFTEHELATVTLLADLIIPADDRSGSASDAGVPAFIDHVMMDELLGPVEPRQTAMRGGLAWIDYECLRRFDGKLFVECSDEERVQLLDVIAYPDDAPAEVEPGVRFFSGFRDLTLSGFFSSRMGVEDLQYRGNTALAAFTGCPPEVMEHIGLGSA
jgi:gluconate 2-dehydrogenase gamma chain